MKRPIHVLLAACIVLASAAGAAWAQADKYEKPADLKPIVPPIIPLPPKSQINPGSFGGNQTPYTTAPLRNSDSPTSLPQTPGLRFTIPRPVIN